METQKKIVTLFQFGNSKKSPQYVLTHALLAYSQVCPWQPSLFVLCTLFLANRCFLTVGITSTVFFLLEEGSTLVLRKQVKEIILMNKMIYLLAFLTLEAEL